MNSNRWCDENCSQRKSMKWKEKIRNLRWFPENISPPPQPYFINMKNSDTLTDTILYVKAWNCQTWVIYCIFFNYLEQNSLWIYYVLSYKNNCLIATFFYWLCCSEILFEMTTFQHFLKHLLYLLRTGKCYFIS